MKNSTILNLIFIKPTPSGGLYLKQESFMIIPHQSDTTQLRIELGINAQKITSQLLLNNETLSSQIQKGLELAIDEILNEDTLVDMIKQQTKVELSKLVSSIIYSYNLKDKIHLKVSAKLDEYVDKISNSILNQL